jgi:hypothetical protein
MVSLNPEYALDVSMLTELADKIKDDKPELYSILVIVIASILGSDEKNLVKYCNEYLSDYFYKMQQPNLDNIDDLDL